MEKIKLILFWAAGFIFLLPMNTLAQSPHRMSYQAVIRNNTLDLVKDQTVGMKVSLLQGTATGTAVYVETHKPSTNATGLISVEIGGGTVVSGSFESIDWSKGPYFIKTETDPGGGSSYSVSSTTQLLSVPYALHAGSATTMGSVNCLDCHNHDRNPYGTYPGSFAERRDNAADEFNYSQHSKGSTHINQGANASCAYCHAQEGYLERVKNNIEPTYVQDPTSLKWNHSFSAPASASSNLSKIPGKVSCFTCHNSTGSEMNTFNSKPVTLALWSFPTNKKTVDLAQNSGNSNLCLSCHQARPITFNTTSGWGGNVLDSLLQNPSAILYDSTKTANTGNRISLSFRTGGHYGWAGNIFAGKGFGPAEIPGSKTYKNSAHTTEASCSDCHMAGVTAGSSGISGGHTFVAKGNLKGCNTTDCHGGGTPITNASLNAVKNAQKAKLDQLAEKFLYRGEYLFRIDTRPGHEGNLWYDYTTKHFDGYFNIFDANSNPNAPFQATSGTPGGNRMKVPTITNGQFACMIIFQAVLREFSGGIHNPDYTDALLTNAIEYMTANPIQ